MFYFIEFSDHHSIISTILVIVLFFTTLDVELSTAKIRFFDSREQSWLPHFILCDKHI